MCEVLLLENCRRIKVVNLSTLFGGRRMSCEICESHTHWVWCDCKEEEGGGELTAHHLSSIYSPVRLARSTGRTGTSVEDATASEVID